MADYDWDAMRAEYVAEGATYTQIRAKYGVSYRQLTAVGREQGWKEERDRCRKKVTQKVVDMAVDRKAQSIANVMTAADKLAQRLIDDMDGLATARDVSDVAKALKYAADTLAQVYGIQTPAQMHRQKMDEERLKLDKRRLELEEQAREVAQNPPQVRIVIERPDEEDELDG